MPIDRKKILEQEEQALDELLERRRLGIGDSISKRRQTIEDIRRSALGEDFSGQLGNLGLEPSIVSAGMAQIPFQQRRLGIQLEDILSGQKLRLNRERVNLAYNRAFDKAQQSGLDRRSQEDFARTVMQDEIRRQNEAILNEKQRQQSIKQQEIANRAFQREQELQQYPDPTAEYQQAVIRILSGMPVQLLTYYGLSDESSLSAMNFLRSGTSISTPINPLTGRRQ